MRTVPIWWIACPKDENECYNLFNTCYEHIGPSAVRYPRGNGIGAEIDKTAMYPIGGQRLSRLLMPLLQVRATWRKSWWCLLWYHGKDWRHGVSKNLAETYPTTTFLFIICGLLNR